jgi:hypothetical protein
MRPANSEIKVGHLISYSRVAFPGLLQRDCFDTLTVLG